MIQIDIRDALKDLAKGFKGLQRDQIPYGSALALTGLANRVAEAEVKGFEQTFDRSTPFTLKAEGVIPARKSTMRATVFVRDIQASYLEAFQFTHVQALGGKRAILGPRNVALNQYGNLPRNKLATLKGKPGVFVGTVHTKSGQSISGVWQRPTAAPAGRRGKRHAGAVPSGKLTLLIRFADPVAVHQELNYFERAKAVINTHLNAEFEAGMAKALATAR